MQLSESLDKKLSMSLDDLVSLNQRESKGAYPKEKRFSNRKFSPYSRPQKQIQVTNRLYVGNLAWETSWQNLKDHFKQAGNVVYADVFMEEGGRSKGCGIVEFETQEEALRAIKDLNDSMLDGRQIFVREDREDDGGQGRFQGGQGGSGSSQVFVGNLPYTTSWQDLKDYFRRFGNVLRADVLTNADGSSKGQGIVLFEQPQEAKKAIRGTNDKAFQGRVLEVREDRFAQ